MVLEAGLRSGSLNTAGHAATLGRPLGAVPGPVTSPASAGCHRLLREFDAVCVVDADQMAELAGGVLLSRAGGSDAARGPGAGRAPARIAAAEVSAHDPAPEVVRVIDALSSRSPRILADVARRAGMTVAEVMSVLGPLEVDGVAVRHPDGWLRRRSR